VADIVTVPRGPAATAAGLLDAAADDRDGLAVRQLAATQAIGYALLAVADQLADLTDASTDLSGQLGDISDHAADIAESLERHRLGRSPGRFTAALEVLRAYGSAR
jgi:hypothetical protein